MADIASLIQKFDQSGREVFWQGSASHKSIEQLELLLASRLSASFKSFLVACGGGGIVGQEVSGIEDDDPTLEYRGTVYGDTLRCREVYALPENFVVIYLGADDVVWCLDTSEFDGDECPVVAFDVFSKKTRQLATTFYDFLKECFVMRT